VLGRRRIGCPAPHHAASRGAGASDARATPRRRLHDFERPAAADFRHGHPIMCADPAKASYNIWIR
jgi:hypothetical protein